MRRRYGVKPNVSAKENVIWFAWPKATAFDPLDIVQSIQRGGMAVREMYVIGKLGEKSGELTVRGLPASRKYTVTEEWGDLPPPGAEALITMRISSFEDEAAAFELVVSASKELKEYQPAGS